MMKKFLLCFILFFKIFDFESYAYSNNNLRIGLLLPFSGEDKHIGTKIYNTVLLSAFELENLNIELYPLDTNSTSQGVAKAFLDGKKDAINIFLGPISIKDFKSLEVLEGFNQSIFFSFSNTENDIPKNVINIGLNLSSQTKSLEKYLNNEKFNYIFFGENSRLTRNALNQFKKYKAKISATVLFNNFNEINIKARSVTNFDIRHKKHLEEIENIKQSEDPQKKEKLARLEKFDTQIPVYFNKVFLSCFDNDLIATLSFFDFYDANYKNVQFITFNQWFDKNLLLEPSAEKLIFPSIDYKFFNELNQAYKKQFNEEISSIETLSYDIIPLIASVWYDKKNKEISALDFKGTFKGKLGSFTINNNKADRDLSLYQIKKGKFVKI